jgi:hypothetical protein
MLLIKKIIARAFFVSILVTILSACIATSMSNVGRTAHKKEKITIEDKKTSTGQWQTNNVSISYSIDNVPDNFTISGSVHISESVTASFPLGDYFNLFINFIDSSGTVISTHNISPLVRYRTEVAEQLPFTSTLVKPADAVFFAFSYIGNFKSASVGEDNLGDWMIYHRPFTDAP